MTYKLNIGVIFGGRSVEHDVSIISGYQAYEAIDRSKYNPIPIYIARDNVWYTGDAMSDISFFRREIPPLNLLNQVYPTSDAANGKLRLTEKSTGAFKKPKTLIIDCVIPVTHGTFGEDGCLQGLLEMANVPYAGSNVTASAIGMDKIHTKAILRANNLPCLDYCQVTRQDYKEDAEQQLKLVTSRFDLPVFVKPATLGSSIGVNSATNLDELRSAIELAIQFCDRVLIEPCVVGGREINCSVIDGDPPLPSVLEEPTSKQGLLSFEEKYMGGKKGGKTAGGMADLTRQIPADLDSVMTQQVQKLAVATFNVIGAGGVARIDFLIDSDNNVYINEINNIPGSLSFYLWEHMGKSFSNLLDRLVIRALEVNRIRNRNIYTFDSNLLTSVGLS